MVGKLSSRDVLMVGLGLYWGEGYKKAMMKWVLQIAVRKWLGFI